MNRRRKVFRILGIVFVLITALFSFHCSRCSCTKKPDRGELTPVKRPRNPQPILVEVRLEPAAPTSIDFIQALPVLKDTTMINTKFSVQWYVNGDRVPEADNRTLDKKFYKKGDDVYCRIMAARGIHRSSWLNSKRVKIGNGPPVLNLSPVGEFQIPCRFHYTITASDPDGDPLTYRLLSPLDMGITLDPETGKITWDIHELPAEEIAEPETHGGGSQEEGAPPRTPPKPTPRPTSERPRLTSNITIKFLVQDSDGAAAVGAIELNLSKEGRVKEVPQ
jgi:hypothetical protein